MKNYNKKKKMMITGADGFLGSRLISHYEGQYDILGIGHRGLDITEEVSVMAFLKMHQPDVVLHCAAISDTGVCEQNPALSEAVNLYGTIHLARACRETQSHLIFMSSDQIYGNSPHQNPNREEEYMEPPNVYGRHKKQAEEELLHMLPSAVCLRLPWMYDFPVRGLKSSHNLLCNMIRSLITNQPMTLSTHDFRGITYAREVVRNMEKAMELPGGIYNFGSVGTHSAYEAAKALLKLLAPGREDLLIADEQRFAGHPRNLTMSGEKLQKYGIVFSDTVEGLELCLEDNPEYRNFLI